MSSSSNQAKVSQAKGIRAILSLLLPASSAVIVGFLAANLWNLAPATEQGSTAVLLSSTALISLLLGLLWYGLDGMGLRGGRALTAGVGFAALAWIIFLILRFIFVEISPAAMETRPPNAGRTFIYLLLFEALATQLWTYGLLFRSVADWRGPLTAAIASGILFGLVATLLFQESFVNTVSAVIFFIAWGVLYGIIRLRTGSLLGTAFVQPMQSFSAWIVMVPLADPNIGQLNNLYLAATIVYMIIAWRLWPKTVTDYRV